MKFLKYSELAAALDVNPATINMVVKRNQLIPTIDGKKKTIDITNDFNKLWIETYTTKNNKTFDINRIYDLQSDKKESKKTSKNSKTPETKPEKPIENKPPSEASLIEIKKKKLELEKLENTNRMERLKIQKMEGLAIPTDAAREVFMYCESTIVTTFRQNIKSLLDIVQTRSGMSHEEYVSLNETLEKQIDIIHNTAKENILTGLDGVVREYQEVRSQGESIN